MSMYDFVSTRPRRLLEVMATERRSWLVNFRNRRKNFYGVLALIYNSVRDMCFGTWLNMARQVVYDDMPLTNSEGLGECAFEFPDYSTQQKSEKHLYILILYIIIDNPLV